MTYTVSLESAVDNYDEMKALYTRHYSEMQSRLANEGIHIPEYNPRLDVYFDAWRRGDMLNFVVRLDGKAVGYSNIYLTNDMHNRELIATEDTIYMLPEHRNGTGRLLSKFILNHLRGLGVKRLSVTALTDLRVAKLWERMGFKHTAHAMTYTF